MTPDHLGTYERTTYELMKSEQASVALIYWNPTKSKSSRKPEFQKIQKFFGSFIRNSGSELQNFEFLQSNVRISVPGLLQEVFGPLGSSRGFKKFFGSFVRNSEIPSQNQQSRISEFELSESEFRKFPKFPSPDFQKFRISDFPTYESL